MTTHTLTGKIAVITGAASGIGKALAIAMAHHGASVALLDRDAGSLDRALADLQASGATALAYPCDVTEAEQCAAAMATVIRTFGGIDVLVNNAGISHHSLFENTDLSVIRKVLDVNFFGAVHCTKAALDSLIARQGTIIAITSIAGFAPLVGRTAYAASKHAMMGFFDSLRTEVGELGVDVLTVAPSFTATDLDAKALAGDGQVRDPGKTMIGRAQTPETVATAIVQAMQKRKRRLILAPIGHASWWVSRLAPDLYARLMRRRLLADYPLRQPKTPR
jgi:NAD(P)-dependent dehydrogenase (short-subunit alcohol dehydrogenase family)